MGGWKRGLLVALLAVGVMAWFAEDLQYRMLYYPEDRRPSAAALAAERLAYWPSGPEGYRGFVAAPADVERRGTIVVFHGNGGTAADRGYYAASLTPLGYRVILAEYPVYGGRPGGLGEASFVADARETIRLAAAEGNGPLYLLGESLGCGVAAAAAADRSLGIAGILLMTPWKTLRGVAKDLFRWLPVGLVMKDRYDSAENLKAFPGPIAVVGAELDDIVPVRHAQALYEALPEPKRLWVLPGVGHNDWLLRADEALWRAWMDFIAGPPVQRALP